MTHHQFIHRHDTPLRTIALRIVAAIVVTCTVIYLVGIAQDIAAMFTESAQ